MSHHIHLSSYARLEIQKALAWTENNFGKKQHSAYKKLIRSGLIHLAKFPLKAPSRPREDIGPGIFVLHIERNGKKARHFFVFRIVDKKTVYIARFLHDSMNTSGLVL